MRFATLIRILPPGARYAGAARHGRRPSVPRCRNSLPPSNGTGLRTAVVLTFLPVVVAPSGEAFRGRKGAGCLSEAQRSEFSAAREKPRSEGNPGPLRGPGSRQSGVFLGYFFARAKKYLAVRSRESAWQAVRRRHVNTGCRSRTSLNMRGYRCVETIRCAHRDPAGFLSGLGGGVRGQARSHNTRCGGFDQVQRRCSG